MTKNLRTLLFFSIFAFLAIPGFAQKGTVKGTITDKTTGEALIGASVVVQGTTIGTSTNIDGQYELPNVNTGSVNLEASFIGYEKVVKTITVTTDGAVVNFELDAGSEIIEELIVIGYGSQKKVDKTGAVSQVKAEEMSGGVLTDPIQGIQGKTAGVLVSKKGGDPNEGFAVRIRGASGFSADTQPLYVIDGVPGVDPTTIAPEDIETFNVLKDAASAAIYGSRGSNGVIIITTKKGKKNSSSVQFNSKLSFDKVAKKYDMLSADEMRDYADQLLEENSAAHPLWTRDSIFTDGGASTDWQDEIFRTGITQSNNLSFSGGNDNSMYYASLTHANWEGVMKGTSKERTNAKVNLTHSALNDKLTLSGTMGGTFENNDYENYDGWDKDDIIYQAISRNPTDPVKNEDGSYYHTIREFNYENPLSIIDNIENVRDAKRFLGNFKADLEIVEGLVGSASIGYIRDDHETSYYRPKNVYATAESGYAKKEYKNNTQKLFEGTLKYDKTLNDVHNLNILGGYSWQESVYNGFYAQGTDPQSEYIGYNDLGVLNEIQYGDVDSWKGSWRLISFFGRAQYNYDSKYYASASLRRDGSSKFGADNKWGLFPTAAIGWNMDREAFLEDVDWLDQLKLRASYGISGNQEIGEYHSLVVWETSGKAINPETGEEVITFKPAWNANPKLKWEQTAETNIGVDFGLFNNRLSGSLEVYQKNTTDLLGDYDVSVPPNLARKTYDNTGELENKGIELFLQSYVVDKSNFKWKTSFNISHNKGKWISLGEYSDTTGIRKEGYISGRGLVGDEYYVTGIIEGEEPGAFYLPVFAQMLDGVFIYKSKSGGYTDKLSEAQRQIVGNANPDFEIGWSNTLTFMENWTLDLSFRAMIGNDVYNATKMFFDDPGNLPSLNAMSEAIDWHNQDRSTGATIADFYVEDASFLRLDYISLGYDIDVSSVNWLSSFRLYVASNNLFTLTNYSGIDPETKMDGLSFGIDQYNVYPKTRTLTFGLNATF